MSLRKNLYRDIEKYKKTKAAQAKRYYAQFENYPKLPFTPEQDTLILAHSIPDRLLSEKICQSIRRIQSRRNYLKSHGGTASSWISEEK